jgi:Protein of unknown function (DUF1376)
MTAPLPMVSTEVDLTDFKFMPLEVARLRRSKAWLICKRRPELAFYMLNLWTASWHERPAGSLEDDDDVLADAAMCPPERWAEVKADALRGWVKCSDGRLYHPVVAEKVAESWHGKVLRRWSNECDRIRKENRRREDIGHDALPLPSKPERNSISIPAEFHKTTDGIPAENALKERDREGTGTGKGESKKDSSPEDPQILAAINAWNDAASRHPRWPKPQSPLSEARRKLLRARITDAGGIPGFLDVLAKAEASQFICDDMKGWSLDWFLKAANFTKVREGNYDHSRNVPPAPARQPMQI